MPGYFLKFPTLLDTFITHAITGVIYIKLIEKIIHFKKINHPSLYQKVDYVSGALIFTNKTTFQTIGGFDDSFFLFYEETDFCKRASQMFIPVICTSEIKFTPIEEKSSSTDVSTIKIKSGIESSKKYHLKYNSLLVTKITFALLKAYYFLLVLLLTPFSVLNEKIMIRRNQFIFRMKIF